MEDLGLRVESAEGLWPEPGMPVAYESEEALFNEVRDFIHDHVDFGLDGEDVEHVVAGWVLLTYRVEDFQAVPYLYFVGPPDSGKTRALEVLWQLCNRAVFSANISSAALFRVVEKYSPTLLLDEAEAYTQGERGSDVQLLLNSGYRRGQKAVRCEPGRSGELKVRCFDVFGPKALAGTGGLMPTLLSRCIRVHMERKTRRVEMFVNEEWARWLRGKLCYYQFHRALKDVEVDEKKLETLGGTRLAEIFQPLLKVAPTVEVQDRIYRYAVNLAGRRREEESASDEALVVKAVADLYYRSGRRAQTTMPVKDVTEKVLELEDVYSERERLSWSRRTGWITARLGFQKTRSSGKTMIRVHEPLLKRLMSRYIPEELTTYFPADSESGEESEKTLQTLRTLPDSSHAESGLNQTAFGLKAENQVDSKPGESRVCRVRRVLSQPFKEHTRLYECSQCGFKAFTLPDLKAHEAHHQRLNIVQRVDKVSALKARVLELVKSRSLVPVGEAMRIVMGEGLSEEEAVDFLIENLSGEAILLHGENEEERYLIPLERYDDYVSAMKHRSQSAHERLTGDY